MPSPKTGYQWCPSLNKWLSPRGTVLPDELQKDARFLFGNPDQPKPERVRLAWSYGKSEPRVKVGAIA